jgi:E3 ubiquitin-protein ligase HUWE1
LEKSVPIKWLFINSKRVEDLQDPVDLGKDFGLNMQAFEEPYKYSTEWNCRMVSHVLEGISSLFLTFLCGVQRMLSSRRVSDSVSKSKIRTVFLQISDTSIKLLNLSGEHLDVIFPKLVKSRVLYLRELMFEMKGTSSILQTMQLTAFDESGGIDASLDLLCLLIDSMETPESLVESLEILLCIFKDLVDEKKFHESPYTVTLLGRQRLNECAISKSFFIDLRKKVLSVVLDIWCGDRFLKLSPLSSQFLIVILTQIFRAGGEALGTTSHSQTGSINTNMLLTRNLPIAVPIVPDPSKIDILCDMGFPRRAAEIALRRYGNNVSRAADYLLNHPGVVATAQESNSATVPPPSTSEMQESGEIVAEELPITIAGAESILDNGLETDQLNEDKQEENAAASLQDLNSLRDDSVRVVAERLLSIITELDSKVLLAAKDLICATAKSDLPLYFSRLCETLENCTDKAKLENDSGRKKLQLKVQFLAILVSDEKLQKQLLTIRMPVNVLIQVLIDSAVVGSWQTPIFLLLEGLLIFQGRPREHSSILDTEGNLVEVAKPEKIDEIISNGDCENLIKLLIKFLDSDEIDETALNAILRLLVILTRSFELADYFLRFDGVSKLFKSSNIARFSFQHSLVMMILRHSIESDNFIKYLMEVELNKMLAVPRLKTLDTSNFIKGAGHLICRDPKLFCESLKKSCILSNYDPKERHHLISFKLGRSLDHYPELPSSAKLMDYFVRQLLELRNPDLSQVDATQIHIRRTFLLQCLSEILTFSIQCKVDLMSISSKKNSSKHNQRLSLKNNFLHYILFEILPVKLKQEEDEKNVCQEDIYKSIESTWAIALVTALCSKGQTSQIEITDKNQKMDYVCNLVLDCILRSLKDCVNKGGPFAIKYGKLTSISDLCKRLLTTTTNGIIVPDKNEETLSISKIMIEKGFVNYFTTAIADIDINHPLSAKIISSVLKPLDLLSKAAILLGKSNILPILKTKKSITSFDHAFREIDNEELTEENAELNEIYRNSALGILQPDSEMDEVSDSEVEDEFDFGAYSDESEDESEDEHSSDEEMEIIIPEPYHGTQDAEGSTFEEEEESNDESIEEDDGEEIDWEEMSMESGEDSIPDYHLEDDAQFVDEDLDDQSNDNSEDSGLLDGLTAEEAPNMEAFMSQRMRNILSAGPAGNSYELQFANRGNSSTLTNEILNTFEDLPMGRPRIARGFTNEETSHPLLIVQNQNAATPAVSEHIYPFQILEHNDLSTSIVSFIRRCRSQNEVTEKAEVKEQTKSERQLSTLHGYMLCNTEERWKQESRVLYGSNYVDVAKVCRYQMLNELIPDALLENRRKSEELKAQQEETERKLKEAADATLETGNGEVSNQGSMSVDEIASNHPSQESGNGSEERQIVMVDGNPVDITGTFALI